MRRIDPSTGLLTKGAFAKMVKAAAEKAPRRSFVIARWDIDRFKVYNDVFGVKKGDDAIAAMGLMCQKAAFAAGCIAYSHFYADHFVSCWAKDEFDPEAFMISVCEGLKECFEGHVATPCFGF